MYSDPIIRKYIDLIKAKNGKIKVFYQGDPTRIPISVLPCCVIYKKDTGVRHFTNAQDEHAIGLVFTVITDIRQDLSTNENDAKVVEGVASLYEIIEGRNEDYTLMDTSLLGILRKNQLVDDTNNLRTDLDNVTTVNYGETLRQRDPEQWTIEARVEIIAHFVQTR